MGAAVKGSRSINLSRIMRAIWMRKGISRVEVASQLSLDKSTVTNLVAELLQLGIVQEREAGESGPQGGRRPVALTINRNYGVVLGFEIGPDAITGVGIDLDGGILFRQTASFATGPHNLAENLRDAVERTRGRAERDGVPVIGVGLGIPGVVDPYRGVILQSLPLGISSAYTVADQRWTDLPVPLFVENDANCCCWGELAFHKEEQLKNFLSLLVKLGGPETGADAHGRAEGISVGLGFVIDGKVYHGASFSAGEFRSILARGRSGSQFSLTDKEALRVRFDSAARGRFLEELSGHIALFMNTLNLTHLFIGGSLQPFREEIVPLFARRIQENWAYPDPVDSEIRFFTHGRDAVAYGAAGMFLDRLFTDSEFLVGGERSGPTGLRLLAGSGAAGGGQGVPW